MSSKKLPLHIRKSITSNTTGRRARFILAFVVIALTAGAVVASASTGTLAKLLFPSSWSIGVNAPLSIVPAQQADKLTAAAQAAATADAQMVSGRRGHTATSFGNGKVLVAGGDSSGSAEIFDVATGTFYATGGMSAPRTDAAAVSLGNGRVLIVGGTSYGSVVSSTEVYDAAAGTFSAGPAMGSARSGASATVLPNGNILIAGGDAGGSAEIYDPTSNAFSAAGSMDVARSAHSAAVMNDGRVLIVGGRDAGGDALSSAEIFNPASGSFSAASSMSEGRVGATMRVLFDGKIQIIGGNDHRAIEIYDPAAGNFGGHAHVPPTNDDHADLINQIMGTSSRAALFNNGETITEIPSAGQAVVIGGGANGAATNAASVYNSSSASVSTDALDYAPGTTVHVSGRGFQAGETVTIMLHEDPHVATENPHTFTATADANGSFEFSEYAPEEADLGVSYILGASGSMGSRAQTVFHDGTVKMIINPLTPTPGTPTITTTMHVTAFNDPLPGDAANACTSIYAGSVLADQVIDNNHDNGVGLGNNTYVLLEAVTPGSDGSAFRSWQNTTGAVFGPALSVPHAANFACVENVKSGNQTWVVNFGGPTKLAFINAPVNAVVNTCQFLTLQTQLPNGTPSNPTNNQPIHLTSSSGTPLWYASTTCSGSPVTDVTILSTGNSVSFGYKDGTVGTPTVTGTPTGSSLTAATQVETWLASCSNASVTTNPSPVTVTYGDSSATFTATGGGTPAPTVQWQVSSGGGPFTNLSNNSTYSGVTTTTLTVSNPTVSLSGNQYRAVFTNTCGGTQTATSTGATLTVNKANAVVVVTPYTVTYDGLAHTAAITSITGVNGETGATVGTVDVSNTTHTNAATYSSDNWSFTGTANYNNISATTITDTINARNATWTTNANSKTYGDSDPVGLTTGSGDFLVADAVTATYSRAAGETVAGGPYHITATLSPAGVLSNYNITNAGNSFTINARNATWTTNANSKTYGDSDPVG
ncbi:MAG: hypothetical protein QOF62_750, partial [Pyrinomonadaceae bacterium]|nr:hypothetical protein [Pyrinomonadaceae bacterium]